MPFIGRKKELSVLETKYASDQFEFVAIFGRRRTGKTAIIQRFIEGKKCIFYQGRRVGSEQNLRLFSDTVDLALGTKTEPKTLDDILETIVPFCSERLILVIDEFPVLAQSVEGAMDSLQFYIDHKFLDSKLFLILCGSSMSFMKKQVLGSKSPLYGRRTVQMEVKPMDYLESAEFFPERSSYEKACIYGIVGGVPMYLLKFRNRRSLLDVVRSEFLDDGAILAAEPDLLIMQEMNNPQRYNSVLMAIACGSNRVSEITASTGYDRSIVVGCLNDLMGLDYVLRTTPVDAPEGKKTRYFLKDNLFRFYYAVVNNRVQQLLGDPKLLGRAIEQYMGTTFEGICKEYLLRCGYVGTGKWWGRLHNGDEAEIDAIGYRLLQDNREEAVFCECKFRNSKVQRSDYLLLKARAMQVKRFDVRDYALFSRSGFENGLIETAKKEGVMLVTLDSESIGLKNIEKVFFEEGGGYRTYLRRSDGYYTYRSDDGSIGADGPVPISCKDVRDDVLHALGRKDITVVSADGGTAVVAAEKGRGLYALEPGWLVDFLHSGSDRV